MSDDSNSPAVSVIIPTLNEEATIGPLLDALLGGSRIPEEIVISDGGSTDATRAIAARYADRRVRIIDGPGGISENRNAAIKAATHDILACTDAGCVPDADWLKHLIEPFETGAKWVGGLSRPDRSSRLQAVIGLAMMPTPAEIDLNHFVPGGASQAFRRSAWVEVGGFPEGMAAGEDTVFGMRLRRRGIQPVIVPQAQVVWHAPTSLRGMIAKAFAWGKADGSVGSNTSSYARIFVVWVGGGVLSVLLLVLRLPRSAIAVLLGVVGASAWQTRRKHPALGDGLGSVVLPFAHAARVTSQAFGWATGYFRSTDRRPLTELARKAGDRSSNLVKRRVKSLAEALGMTIGGRQPVRTRGRSNVDLLLPAGSDQAEWLAALPDTYRVGIEPTPITDGDRTPDFFPATIEESTARRLAAAVTHGRAAAVLAREHLAPPSRGTEPDFEAVAVAVDPDLISIPEGADAASAFHLIRQAGVRYAVVFSPVEVEAEPTRIEGVGAALILGTVPMHDVGGGSRGAQLAHELVARGYHVTYLNLFDSNEVTDLGLRYIHARLEEIPAEEFDVERYGDRLSTSHRVAILELPHSAYFDLISDLQTLHFKVVYDLMDDWSDRALGGWGYDPAVELAVATVSDALVASAASLVGRLRDISGRSVELVPNAVNTRLFDPEIDHPRPDDLPPCSGPVIEYHGSLYGAWFDWEALQDAAEQHTEACFVVIGDEAPHPQMPANVHFLGLKPQHLLPAYLAHTDVAIIPFEVSDTTHAVSPLKVFEYLAMGVRVASVPLEPLIGLDGVHTDVDLGRAISVALAAERPDPATIAEQHGWGARLGTMFAAAGIQLQTDTEATQIVVEQRQVVHWKPAERRI